MMKQFLLLLFIGCQFVNAQTNCEQGRYVSEVFSNVQKTENVLFANVDPYGLLNSQNLYLDVFEPVGDTLPLRPLVLHQFGGGFLIGWRTEPVIPQMGESYAKRGFVFATIDYRLGFNVLDGQSAERAVYRASQDLRASLRYLVDNAATYGIDTSQIFLTGTSAGCLAAFVNTFMNESDRVDIPSTYGIPLEPQDLGCANCAGNNNFNNQEVPVKGIINNWGAMLDTSYIDLATDPADNVPVISFHGTDDNIVPYAEGSPFSLPIFPDVQGSFLIHERLTNQGIKNRLYPLQGLGHEPQLLQLQGWVTDTILELGSKFLHEIMQPQTSNIQGPTSDCVGRTATYSVDLHAGNKYCWEVSGATILSQQGNTITVIWDSLGMQEIRVVENNYLDAHNRSFVEVIIGEEPNASFTYMSEDGLFNISAIESTANNYTWDFGDGTSSNSPNTMHQYTDTGSFTITLSVANNFCTSTSQQTIVSDLCPVAAFLFEENDSTVTFLNSSSFGNNVVWLIDDSISFNGDSTEWNVAMGMHSVTIIVNNAFCSDTLTETITIDYCPQALFDFITNGLEVSLTNNSINNNIDFWNFGEGSTTSIPNPTFVYDAPGVYTIQLIVYNNNLCSDTLTQTINVQLDDTTSIRPNVMHSPLHIYPNPTSNSIEIETPMSAKILEAQVFNLEGKMVASGKQSTLHLHGLKSGLYMIKVTTKDAIYLQKIVKE